jgi:hypothetical protein
MLSAVDPSVLVLLSLRGRVGAFLQISYNNVVDEYNLEVQWKRLRLANVNTTKTCQEARRLNGLINLQHVN